MHNRQKDNSNTPRENAFLEKISARIAPRNAWQAMDLGVRIYQTWWKPLTLIWLSVTLVPLVLILSLTGIDNALWGCLAWWWLKPLWERPLLEYCARALFSDAPTITQLMRELPRHSLSGIAPWLLLRRLDPARGMHLAVTQLEKQHGASYQLRVRNLSLGINDHASSLTMIMLLIEQLIAVGLVMLVAMLAPDQYYLREMDWVLDDNGEQAYWLFIGAWYLATALCEPLYICSSFALYLNKRTWLEGWDLEIGMRQIGEKRHAKRSALGAMLLLAFTLGLMQLPSNARAEEPPSANQVSPVTESNSQERAINILAGPKFSPMEIKDSWRFKDLFDNKDDPEEDDTSSAFWNRIFEWIASLFDNDDKAEDPEKDENSNFELPTLAEIFRFIIWVIVVSLVIWVAINARRWLSLIERDKRYRPRATHVAGLDIRPESLPNDVTAHAIAALEQGHLREALSLLYRATLSKLLSNIDTELAPGATESECLRALQIAQPKKADQTALSGSATNTEKTTMLSAGVLYLQTLTPLWINTAWAHRPPEQESIRALALQWQTLFEPSTSQANSSALTQSSQHDKGTHQ